jgi:hypothetical protein
MVTLELIRARLLAQMNGAGEARHASAHWRAAMQEVLDWIDGYHVSADLHGAACPRRHVKKVAPNPALRCSCGVQPDAE